MLYERITLPEGDDDIMPPPEKGLPLTNEETELIRQWIEQGANYGTWKGSHPQDKPATEKTH